MRFRNQSDSRRQAVPAVSRRGPSLRLAAMLGALVLVFSAMARLEQPATHRALGRVLGESSADKETVSTPTATPRRLSIETFAEVRDNAPFRNEEQPAWFATLASIQQATAEDLSAVSSGPIGYAALTSQPTTYRGRVVTVAGKVRRVETVVPAENDRGIQQLWRVTLEPIGGEVWPITIYTLAEPRDATEPYDASAIGVFFKNLSYRWAEGVGITPIVVASRLETTLDVASGKTFAHATAPDNSPTTIREEEVNFATPTSGSLGRALLADWSVDLEELDAVEDRRRLTSKDTPTFYKLLGTVSQTPATQLVRLARVGLDDYVTRHTERAGDSLRDRQTLRALQVEQQRRRYSVVPLFGDGAAERGELVTIDAVVRRAVRVDASQSEVAADAGVTHYYELEAFTEDSQNLPVVFVVRELPAGFPVGNAIRQPARLAGFFFKQWAYRTRKPSENDPTNDRRQFAPLLIGRAPIPLAVPDASSARPGLAIGLAATLGLVTIAVALWRLNRRDRQYESATLARFRRHRDDGTLDFDHLERLSETP